MNPQVSIKWAMPSRWTFSIPPIRDFVHEHTKGCRCIVDPFAGQSVIGTHRNDIRQSGIHSADWLDTLIAEGVRADCVLFDPPYSPRQVAECYSEIGRKCNHTDTQNGRLYKIIKSKLDSILAPGGTALSFGWQSGGFGKRYVTTALLLVQHGGAHNDTICVAHTKPANQRHATSLFEINPAPTSARTGVC